MKFLKIRFQPIDIKFNNIFISYCKSSKTISKLLSHLCIVLSPAKLQVGMFLRAFSLSSTVTGLKEKYFLNKIVAFNILNILNSRMVLIFINVSCYFHFLEKKNDQIALVIFARNHFAMKQRFLLNFAILSHNINSLKNNVATKGTNSK